MSIHDQLVPLIRKAGVRHVAAKAGVSLGALSEWLNELNHRRLGDKQVDAIADVLAVDVHFVQRRAARPARTLP
jgi:hypothetical protein